MRRLGCHRPITVRVTARPGLDLIGSTDASFETIRRHGIFALRFAREHRKSELLDERNHQIGSGVIPTSTGVD